MIEHQLPQGFVAAGANVGIKNSKPDCGVLLSEAPSVVAACVTQNKSRAPNTARIERLAKGDGDILAVVTLSGNANALTGDPGVQDDLRVAEAVAKQLDIQPDQVLTAYTGVVGHRLPVQRIVSGLGDVLSDLKADPEDFAKSVLTTDKVTKLQSREIFIAGHRVHIQAVAKGSGMIAPSLATTLVFLTTDAAISKAMLQKALFGAVDDTLNQLTVDQEMSTNDAVIALANGLAKNPLIETEDASFEVFSGAVQDIFTEVARSIADDGEGATRRIEVQIKGATSRSTARAFARSVAGSMLIKSAVFGADPNMAGRVMATIGACATRCGEPLDLTKVNLQIEGWCFFKDGAMLPIEDPAQVRYRLSSPVIRFELDLGLGEGRASAFGCDLSYDYVKINADYAAITKTSADGRVGVNERLADLGPTIKHKILVQALAYMERFKGIRAVIKLGGAAMVDPKLEAQFAQDVLLLRAVGLKPIVVHGGAPEITQTMQRLGRKAEFVDGLRVTDAASMGVVEMVLTGSVNQRLVAALNQQSSIAVGVSGKDGGLIRARKMSVDRKLGQVGEVDRIDTRLIDMLERDNYIPVISPVGLGDDGLAYNLDSDVVAAELATALKATKLIFLCDATGLIEGDKVTSELNGDQLKRRLEAGTIDGPMQPMMQAALRALRGGLASVHLVDGRVRHNLIAELFTDSGVGTVIRHA